MGPPMALELRGAGRAPAVWPSGPRSPPYRGLLRPLIRSLRLVPSDTSVETTLIFLGSLALSATLSPLRVGLRSRAPRARAGAPRRRFDDSTRGTVKGGGHTA